MILHNTDFYRLINVIHHVSIVENRHRILFKNSFEFKKIVESVSGLNIQIQNTWIQWGFFALIISHGKREHVVQLSGARIRNSFPDPDLAQVDKKKSDPHPT